VEVVNNAVEEDFGEEAGALPKEECQRKIGLVDRRIVLSAGRLVSWKGFREVVLAARSLPSETVVLIVGEGPERVSLARLVDSMGLSKRVRLMGKAPRAELAVYLRAADCFVLNSGYESCSHIMLEAMKMGTPVVVARTTGIPEMIEHGENGLLFEKDNVVDMVSCITECLDDKRGSELADEAKRRLSDYAWESVFARTLDILRGAARKGR
jgi:glycosyltransferase involved in cell wall biosynthesis